MIVMGIISYRVKQNLTIYIGEVLKRRGRGILTGAFVQWVRLELPLIQKVCRKIFAMEWFFSKVPGCKLQTWVRVVSTTHASLEIREQQFFGTFQKSYFNYFATPFSSCFCKTPRISCSICFSSFLRRCLPFLTSLRKR